MRIAVIGLGLMGASLTSALKGYQYPHGSEQTATIIGMDIDKTVCLKAKIYGVADEIYENVQEAVQEADVVIFCVYPHLIADIIAGAEFKKGAVITDICGVKSPLYKELMSSLPPETDYVGIHPMAGKEIDGFDNADKNIFKNTGFIITPLPSTKPESVELMRSIAFYTGAARIEIVSPEIHDDIIAYTSDLMHISAAALCVDYHKDMTLAYTAGAFRDCTRIANINAPLWTELLLSNKEFTMKHLKNYIENLQKIYSALETEDGAGLNSLLQTASDNKKILLKK